MSLDEFSGEKRGTKHGSIKTWLASAATESPEIAERQENPGIFGHTLW